MLCAALATAAHGEEAPLWELGGGAAAITFPDYRGSAHQRSYLLPAPMIVYRGEFLEADRERMRGVFFRSKHAEVDVSVNGSVPVRSEGSGPREGMPDLDPTLEIGPSWNVRLLQAPRHTLWLRTPVRAVIASDLRSVHGAGVLANPNLNLDLRLDGEWKLGLQAGALIGSRRYHDYFYGVSPQYAAPGRPEYHAAGGYSGAQLIASLTKRFDRLFVGAFAKADFLAGATFLGSPLVERRDNFAAGVAVTWVFARSPRKVTVRE